nr:dopamine receptor 4-like [Hydra vulgaris]
MNLIVIHTIFLVVLSICIVIINGACIYVISTSKRLLQNPSIILILNIILIHFFQGIIVMPLYSIELFNGHGLVCGAYRFTSMLAFYGSCLSVFLLSLDRLLAIKMLTAYHVNVTKCRVLKSITLCWTYVVGLCLIPFFPFAKKTSSIVKCSYNQPKLWSILMLVVNALLVYIFIVFNYVLVRQKLRKTNILLRESTNSRNSGMNQGKCSKLFKVSKTTYVILWLVLCYAITWAPTIVYVLVQRLSLAPSIFNKHYYKSQIGAAITFYVKYINFFDGIISPIIFCYNFRAFRLKFKKINLKWSKSSNNSQVKFGN